MTGEVTPETLRNRERMEAMQRGEPDPYPEDSYAGGVRERMQRGSSKLARDNPSPKGRMGRQYYGYKESPRDSRVKRTSA